ncbi:hypothetical protein Tco_0524084 [Tanacetum coccineum]
MDYDAISAQTMFVLCMGLNTSMLLKLQRAVTVEIVEISEDGIKRDWSDVEIHNDSHLLQQPSEDGIQVQEGQADPTLMIEIEDDNMQPVDAIQVKSYHDNMNTKDKYYYEKEIAEAIAEIRLKYCNKHQEADANFNSQKKEVGNNMNTVAINQVLVATFIQKRQDVSRDCAALQQVVREVAKDLEKMEDYRRLSNELRNDVRMGDKYISELQIFHMSDEVVESIKILRRMQLDDMEKASRLLLMAREIHYKVYEKNTFIANLRA